MNPEVHAPGWEWYYVAMYFFVGGVSAGAYVIASLAELFGGERHREISRTGYFIAFPLILLAPPLLIADLGRPERFWHLLLQARNGFPSFNIESPLSVGSWALLVYGAMALLSFLDNLVEEGKAGYVPFARIYDRRPRRIYAVVGSGAGFFVAGYTGVVLDVTARPLWAAADPLIGALFIASAASTGAAAILLAMAARKTLPKLRGTAYARFDRIVMILELALAIGVVLIAGKYAEPLFRGFNATMFWGGAVIAGTLVPLASGWYAVRSAPEGQVSVGLVRLTSVLVLLGGALLRISLVQAGQA